MQTTQEEFGFVTAVGWIFVAGSIACFIRYLDRCGLLNVGLPQVRRIRSVKEFTRAWPGHSVELYTKYMLAQILTCLIMSVVIIGNDQPWWPELVPFALVAVLGVMGLIHVRTCEQRSNQTQPK